MLLISLIIFLPKNSSICRNHRLMRLGGGATLAYPQSYSHVLWVICNFLMHRCIGHNCCAIPQHNLCALARRLEMILAFDHTSRRLAYFAAGGLLYRDVGTDH